MLDEQLEELDILQSIYPEEITVHSDTSLSIHLRLETVPPKQLLVDVDFPEDYPEAAGAKYRISKEDVTLLSTDQAQDSALREVPDYIYDFTDKDLSELATRVEETSLENIGMQAVFTVVSQLKENAEELYERGISRLQAEHLRQVELAEEKEQAKFRGTPVTKESYAEWFTKFRAERDAERNSQESAASKGPRPLTGKEIFEQGIEGTSDAEEED